MGASAQLQELLFRKTSFQSFCFFLCTTFLFRFSLAMRHDLCLLECWDI